MMKTCHWNRCRIRIQLVGSTTMKKMAKVIVGKSMGGGQSRAAASRHSWVGAGLRACTGGLHRGGPGRVGQPIWYTTVTSTETGCDPGLTGGVGAAVPPDARGAPDAGTGGPAGTLVDEIESRLPSVTPAASASWRAP